MAQRSFSVVVLPDDWDGSLEELAQKMMPVTRRGPNQVLPLLARGAMTLEADLSVEEAGLLQARLNKLGVPARVVDGAGEVVADSAHEGANAAAQGEKAADQGEEKEKPKKKLRLPKPKAKKSAPEPASEPESSGEWGSVFPDLGEESSSGFGAEPAPKEPEQDALAPKDAKPQAPSPEPQAPSPKPQAPSPEPQAPSSEPQAPSPPRQPPSPGPKPQAPSPKPSGFDAGKMSDALRSANGDKPPYAPDGFDDSMSHIPALAGVLSALAPGAGQIYNGQDEQAREFGVRFALIVPWYNSVRQAYEYAEKIRTYWAPLPEKGALASAVKYMVIWWAIAGSAVAALGWSGSKLYDVAKKPEAPKITEADIENAFDEARSQVQIARMDGLDGVTAYLDERDRNHKRFTMSKAERAQRLFRRGLTFCKEGKYATCESAMKRVTSLSPELRRDAYRLQAWASVQQSGEKGDQPMPEVDAIGSLADFEREQQASDTPDDSGADAQPETPADNDELTEKDEPTDHPP